MELLRTLSEKVDVLPVLTHRMDEMADAVTQLRVTLTEGNGKPVTVRLAELDLKMATVELLAGQQGGRRWQVLILVGSAFVGALASAVVAVMMRK